MDTGIGAKYTFSDGTPTHICIHFIFIANKSSGLHFPSNDIGLSSLKFFWWVPEFLFTSTRGRFSRSRSSKVDKFGANRKCGVDFLLVRNSNWSYLAPFRRSDRFYMLLTPPLFNPNFGGVPVAPDRRCWVSTGTWALSYPAVKLFSKNSNLFEHGT